jgi:transposase
VEAQIDWYESDADLSGERVKLQVFSMRSMANGAAFHYAYLHATQQAFLDAHELAFAYFGGVSRKLRYDNLTSAVKRILRGSRRDETARSLLSVRTGDSKQSFARRRNRMKKVVLKEKPNTSGGNYWVPVPAVPDVRALNQQLLTACQQDERRLIAGTWGNGRRGIAGGSVSFFCP